MKSFLARIMFFFLGRGFQAAYSLDAGIQAEIADWPESTTILMRIFPSGPAMTVAKRNDRIYYLGLEETPADFVITFKSLDGALLVLLGRISIAQAYAEHRFVMYGDIMAVGMPLVRCLYQVENYLFPRFITHKLFNRFPIKSVNSLRVYLKILLAC